MDERKYYSRRVMAANEEGREAFRGNGNRVGTSVYSGGIVKFHLWNFFFLNILHAT